MKKLVALMIFCSLGFVVAPAFAEKDCEELKTEIAAKLEAKGVTNYTLEIVENDAVTDQKVVGSCAGGTKKIIYKKN